jgi:uncharacterized protein (DUF1697 family)
VNNYLALLRGINVGGSGMLRMVELRTALSGGGLSDVRTYIQSGNVLFSSKEKDTDKLIGLIESILLNEFKLSADVAVFTKPQWHGIITNAPALWGVDDKMKHNLMIMIKPYDMDNIASLIGDLRPDIETIEVGNGVLYQSMSAKLFGKTTTSKLMSTPLYKKITIRNYNTSLKLLSLMD